MTSRRISGLQRLEGAGRSSPIWPVVPDPERPLGAASRLLLVAEILRDYARAYRLMRTAPIAEALARLRSHDAAPSPPTPNQHEAALRLSRTVMLTLRRLPTDRRCLVRSLVVSGVLARRGIPAQLVLGVRPDSAEPFVAHAWVEHGGECVLPDDGFSRLHAL